MGKRVTSDEIIQELWQAKDRPAKEFNYSIDALAAELLRRQKQSGREVVSFAKDTAGQNSVQPE